jgi:hypothetical protein
MNEVQDRQRDTGGYMLPQSVWRERETQRLADVELTTPCGNDGAAKKVTCLGVRRSALYGKKGSLSNDLSDQK